ncbi:uncharacterized protein EKO05_0010652 [Ascochyta rabiei]|uniref:uncharacterized protein n=1 Tax=Didymella rabiei TaxID=5454 RepID=UPI0021FAAE91|nr:uncharacterized protein EKO05_0010652 [Ascochyta rabiei]UPX20420.1 hypothetical protein EKO05_0010652 [Ascochyta rabiei]
MQPTGLGISDLLIVCVEFVSRSCRCFGWRHVEASAFQCPYHTNKEKHNQTPKTFSSSHAVHTGDIWSRKRVQPTHLVKTNRGCGYEYINMAQQAEPRWPDA